jgi:hypothetical protein
LNDLDILILVRDSPEPRWFMRAAAYDTGGLSVGADVFVYTEAEAARMGESGGWMRGILREAVWL